MVKKTIIPTLLVCCCLASAVFATEPSDYLIPGKSYMCEGSLSGLRLAYQTFDAGLKDTSCADCNTNRELIFLHAVTRTAMLFIDNNDLAVKDSFLELADAFGVKVIGDYFDQLDVNVPLDPNGRYKIPAGAPDFDEISNIVHSWITEINSVNGIVAELNSIGDSPSDHFRFFFEPGDTGLENPLEVDYGDLLILKGLLLAFKSELESRQAYDVFLNVNETLLHKLLYEDGINPEEPNFAELAAVIGISDPCNISVNDDFLNPYPNLLKVLPTPGHTEDGAAILAQAKQDLINGINYYFDAFNYIAAENVPPGTDPQEDELVYVDPNDRYLDALNQKLTALRDSLVNDTNMLCPVETTKTYNVYDSTSKLIGQMILVYDLTGLEGESNSLTLNVVGTPSPWEIEWFDVVGGDGSQFEADLEYHSSGHWWEGYLEGTLNTNGNITDVNFDYWGDCDYSCGGHCCSVCSYDSYCCDVKWDRLCDHEASTDPNCNCGGTLEKLSCQLISTKVENINFDLNPVFGSSPRYPSPVNPRDLLPQFDQKNVPITCTFGHGLGNDATLGGILPDMTQQDWATLLGLGFLQGDSDIDCDVDFADYAILAVHWMNQNCTETNWCDRADINQSGEVDIFDLRIFAEHWLEGAEP
jgi:hypothetical protein